MLSEIVGPLKALVTGPLKYLMVGLDLAAIAFEMSTKEKVRPLIDQALSIQKVQKRRVEDIYNLIYDYWDNLSYLDKITFTNLFYIRVNIYQGPSTLAAICYAVNDLREEDSYFNKLYKERVLINPLV